MIAADMLTNVARDLDDHDLSILHTQNGLVGVACVKPLQKNFAAGNPRSCAATLLTLVLQTMLAMYIDHFLCDENACKTNSVIYFKLSNYKYSNKERKIRSAILNYN